MKECLVGSTMSNTPSENVGVPYSMTSIGKNLYDFITRASDLNSMAARLTYDLVGKCSEENESVTPTASDYDSKMIAIMNTYSQFQTELLSIETLLRDINSSLFGAGSTNECSEIKEAYDGKSCISGQLSLYMEKCVVTLIEINCILDQLITDLIGIESKTDGYDMFSSHLLCKLQDVGNFINTSMCSAEEKMKLLLSHI